MKSFVSSLKYGAALMAAALSGGMSAWAAPVVSSQLQVQQVVLVQKQETTVPVQSVKPGDVIEYRATYANTGDQDADAMQATLPVPTGTTLQNFGMAPAGALASIDDAHYSPMPLMRTVTGKDGKRYQEPVPLSEIRSLRWNLGKLGPNQSKAVQMRVRVDEPSVATVSVTNSATASGAVRAP